jgi:hypothetical protein
MFGGTRYHGKAISEIKTLIEPEDRKPSEVRTYKLTADEIEARYGNIKKTKEKAPIIFSSPKGNNHYKKREKGSTDMKLTKANVLELKANGKTVEEIIEIFRPTWTGKENFLIGKVKAFMDGVGGGRPKKEQATQNNGKVTNATEKVTNATEKVTNATEKVPVVKLYPRTLISRDTNITYDFGSEALAIIKNEGDADSDDLTVEWKDLDVFIAELQEIKSIVEQIDMKIESEDE